MNYENPTALQIGHEGVLSRRRYRVVGRVVLGMEYEGTTYYWNEYHLKDEGGRSATLVYEETEEGSVWRLFTLFEPAQPISVRVASSISAGQTVQLDGVSLKVDLVDESRVYHIEGEPPEGVEIGDVASYLNASSSDRMVVVSWSGDEVEHFHGLDLSEAMVAGAFNLPQLAQKRVGARSGGGMRTVLLICVLLGIVGGIWVALQSSEKTSVAETPKESKTVVRPAVAKITLGAVTRLASRDYLVKGSAEIATAQYRGNYTRIDYWLERKDGGAPAWLYRGLGLSGKDCYLVEPYSEPMNITPQKAAILRTGSPLTIGGDIASVEFLFRSKVMRTEGNLEAGLKSGGVYYQLVARAGAVFWILAWNETDLRAWRGSRIAEDELAKAFPSGTSTKK